ncbi:MAG: deoxyhypusine synthase family protein [Okeania sp. SIO2C2]|uniref:deoxyhypusine synthase family protein n=1 Tax=Okeania sp. SIO2C2 TaxID=2607787 RepID=UPI0013B70967|nr:deoxyhypusine synthase family protein [Okeania sp. SIO2C2]NEP86996.1 deoxyhypusine synthase family protein [Okeania sp. SIO2C2]
MVNSRQKILTPLNLDKCLSVGSIVEAMNECSFGARMLGEVTNKIYDWITKNQQPLAIYEVSSNSPLDELLTEMVRRKWLKKVLTIEDYAQKSTPEDNVVVIGAYSQRYENILYNKPKEAIYINQYGIANPHQINDGYFPNVVFADPRLILPLIFTSLEEKLIDKKTDILELIATIKKYGGLATEVSEGCETLLTMVKDPDCFVFLTISGAMTIAKMGLIFCDLIDKNMVQGLCSTGALMAHGLVESVGLNHFKYNPHDDDQTLAKLKLNRVTDTLEPESNLTDVTLMMNDILAKYEENHIISPTNFHNIIGEYLSKKYGEYRGILKSAYEQNVPVFVPAFYDSEIGNNMYIHNLIRKNQGQKTFTIDMESDIKLLLDIFEDSPKIGIFTIGGGVPRNFIQNVAPLKEHLREELNMDFALKKITYGCRICPDPMYYGHLSGCTYSEGMSWRKMNINGKFSEVHADATLILPLMVKYVIDCLKT